MSPVPLRSSTRRFGIDGHKLAAAETRGPALPRQFYRAAPASGMFLASDGGPMADFRIYCSRPMLLHRVGVKM